MRKERVEGRLRERGETGTLSTRAVEPIHSAAVNGVAPSRDAVVLSHVTKRSLMSQSKISRFFASRAASPSPPPSSMVDGRAQTPSKRPRLPAPLAVSALVPVARSHSSDSTQGAPRSVRVMDVAARLGRSNLTPLEQQVVALKSSAADALLLVEVGYKYIGPSAGIEVSAHSQLCAARHRCTHAACPRASQPSVRTRSRQQRPLTFTHSSGTTCRWRASRPIG